jgi:hypothetical protein
VPSMDGQHVFRLAQTDFVVTLRCPGARYESCREGECNLNVVDMFGMGRAEVWAGSCRTALVVSVMPCHASSGCGVLGESTHSAIRTFPTIAQLTSP